MPVKSSEIFTLSKLNLKLELGVVAYTCQFSIYLEVEAGKLGNLVLKIQKQNKARAGEIVQ